MPERMTQGSPRLGAVARDFRMLTRALLARPACLGVHGAQTARARLSGREPRVEQVDQPPAAAAAAPLRAVRLSLPRRLFLARDVVLPGRGLLELGGMLRYEIAGLFPVPAEELIWDWFPRCARDDGYTVCRVMAIEHAVAARELDASGLSDAPRVGLEPATASLANSFLAARGAWPDAPVLLAAVAAAGLELVILGPGGIECDRGAALDAEGVSAERLAGEIDILLSIHAQDSFSRPVERILAAGRIDDEALAALSSRVGLPAERFVAPDLGPRARKAASPENASGENADSDAAAAQAPSPTPETADRLLAQAAAFGPLLKGALSLKFVSPDRARRERSRLSLYQASAGLLLAAMAVALVWSALVVRNSRAAAYVAAVEARVAEIAPRASDIDAKRQRLSAIQRQLEGQGRVLDVLTALYRVTPPDIFLTSVNIDSRGMLTIRGHAQQLFRPSEYAIILERDPIFGRPTQQGPASQQQDIGGKTFISFTIVRDLGAGKEK